MARRAEDDHDDGDGFGDNHGVGVTLDQPLKDVLWPLQQQQRLKPVTQYYSLAAVCLTTSSKELLLCMGNGVSGDVAHAQMAVAADTSA